MSQHEDKIRLQHMLDHAREAVALVKDKSRASLDHERLLQLGLVRLIEIVGEAAARVSAQGREKYPSIPWREAAGIRNRLIHGYDTVDLDVLWDTVALDLPPLILELERIVGQTA